MSKTEIGNISKFPSAFMDPEIFKCHCLLSCLVETKLLAIVTELANLLNYPTYCNNQWEKLGQTSVLAKHLSLNVYFQKNNFFNQSN